MVENHIETTSCIKFCKADHCAPPPTVVNLPQKYATIISLQQIVCKAFINQG